MEKSTYEERLIRSSFYTFFSRYITFNIHIENIDDSPKKRHDIFIIFMINYLIEFNSQKNNIDYSIITIEGYQSSFIGKDNF